MSWTKEVRGQVSVRDSLPSLRLGDFDHRLSRFSDVLVRRVYSLLRLNNGSSFGRTRGRRHTRSSTSLDCPFVRGFHADKLSERDRRSVTISKMSACGAREEVFWYCYLCGVSCTFRLCEASFPMSVFYRSPVRSLHIHQLHTYVVKEEAAGLGDCSLRGGAKTVWTKCLHDHSGFL